MMDSQALERIYREQVGRVYRLCCCYLKNRADAEDVTQDAFVQLMRSGKRLEGTEHEKAWLLRTAANLCRNRLNTGAAGTRTSIPAPFRRRKNRRTRWCRPCWGCRTGTR